MRYIAVEGNIGAGKSTVIDALARDDAVLSAVAGVLPEPIADWAPILPDFYADPPAHALRLQLEILRSRTQQVHDLAASTGYVDGAVAVIERCVESSARVFVPCLDDAHVLAPGQRDAHERWYRTLRDVAGHTLAAVVFLDAPPSVCLERMRSRSRSGESDVSLEYLARLDAAYRAWLAELERDGGVPVLRVDAIGDARAVVAGATCAVKSLLLSTC